MHFRGGCSNRRTIRGLPYELFTGGPTFSSLQPTLTVSTALKCYWAGHWLCVSQDGSSEFECMSRIRHLSGLFITIEYTAANLVLRSTNDFWTI